MPKFFVTQPTSFLSDGETTMGTYNWCVDNAGCEKAMCAITNVSYKSGKAYENMTSDDNYTLVKCSDLQGLDKLDEWQGLHKIQYIGEPKQEFRMTQPSLVTEMSEGADVVTCDPPSGWCTNAGDVLTKMKCNENNGGHNGATDTPHLGYQCMRGDKKAFFGCDGAGFVTSQDWEGLTKEDNVSHMQESPFQIERYYRAKFCANNSDCNAQPSNCTAL